MKKFLILLLILTSTTSLLAQGPVEVDEIYEKELYRWQRSMTRWKLRNFVPLIGLHLLKEGPNTFGKDPSNAIVIDSKDAEDFMGVIVKDGKSIIYRNTNGIDVKLESEPIKEITFTFDADRNSERLRHKFTKWYVQYVKDEYFLRVMDDTSPLVSTFEPYDFFAANGEFIFEGRYKPYKSVKVIELNNVIASSESYNHTGVLSFKYQGKKYKLEVLEGRFLMFTDETNGDNTFPYGRYLRISPNDDGSVLVDFNKSFSPPRSVSLYTTCEIPPRQNHLPFAITAGEKYDGETEGIIREIGHSNN